MPEWEDFTAESIHQDSTEWRTIQPLCDNVGYKVNTTNFTTCHYIHVIVCIHVIILYVQNNNSEITEKNKLYQVY